MNSIKKEEIVSEEFNDEYLKQWTECKDERTDHKPSVTDVSSYVKDKIKEDVDSEYSDSDNEAKHSLTKDNELSSDNDKIKKVEYMGAKEKMRHLNGLIQKLCKGAPLSEKVSNLCFFKCPMCEKLFKGWNPIKRHFSQKHRGARKLCKLEVDSLISKTIAHTCKLCSEKVLCDSVFISRHLANHDNMTLYHYTMLFSANAFKIIPKVKFSKDVIGSLCLYQCIDCGKKFERNGAVTQHKRKSFHMKNIKNINTITEKVYHNCKLCKKPILCDESTLQKHFTRNHNITTTDYCKKFQITHHTKRKRIETSLMESLKISENIDNLCVFACPICQKKYFSSLSIGKHLKQHNCKSLEHVISYLIKGFSYQCKNCFKLLLCDIHTIHYHLRHVHNFTKESLGKVNSYTHTKRIKYDEFSASYIRKTPVSSVCWNKTVLPFSEIPIQEINSRIGNLCTFACPHCDTQSFPNWLALRHHCKIVHNCGIQYNPSLVSVARCHACLLCPKVVLNDRYFLHIHLKGSHKRKLAEYERILQKNGGETLPSFITWLRTNQSINE